MTAACWSGPAAAAVKVRIRAALRDRVEALFEKLFGKPTRSKGRQWRYHGGLLLDVRRGTTRGRWFSHTAQDGGGPVEAIRFALGHSVNEAWQWAADYTGIAPPGPDEMTPEERAEWRRQQQTRLDKERKRRDAQEARMRAQKLDEARACWKAGTPIAGTLGDEPYLTTVRCIPRPAEGWPDCIRWLENDYSWLWKKSGPSVLFAATTPEGEIEAVQQVYLDRHGRNKRRLDGSKIKLTRGPRKHSTAAVRLPSAASGDFDAPILHSEGCETGLTGWRATGRSAQIWLGGPGMAQLAPGRSHIWLADDDAPGSPAARALEKALDGWRQDGIRVAVATPWAEPRGDKSDFNDVLRQTKDANSPDIQAQSRLDGLAAVAARIRLAELALEGLSPAPAPFPLPTATANQVRAAISHALGRFFRARGDGSAPRMQLGGLPGSGKSQMTALRLPARLDADRKAGQPHRIVVLTKSHRIAEQLCDRYVKLGINAATYQSRGDPFLDEEESALCKNMVEVKHATIAQEPIGTAVCMNTKKGTCCRFYRDCATAGYYAQLQRAIEADVVFAAHNFFFQEMPKKLFDNVGTVIIEEDFTSHGYGTIDRLSIDGLFDGSSLAEHPVLHGKKRAHRMNYSATNDLAGLYQKIWRALSDAAEGRITLRAALREQKLTPADIADARTLTWRRKRPAQMYPGMSPARREELAELAKHHLTLPKIATTLHALEKLARESEGPPDLFTGAETSNGAFSFSGGRYTVHGLKTPNDWLSELPVLILSATARPDLVQKFFPDVEVVAPPAPALPYQIVHQRLGPAGKSAMTRGKLADLVVEVRLIAATGKTVLVLVHKDHEAAFRGIPGVSTLHHGDVDGDDDYRDVDVVFQIGAPFAPPAAVARQASAELGRYLEEQKSVRTPCAALMTDGSGVAFERLAYENPAMQRVHAGTYDNAFVQGLGRGRGINRTAANPVEIIIHGNVPLPFPVTTIERRRKPSRVHKQALARRIHTNPHDAVRFHPDLYQRRRDGSVATADWRSTARTQQRWGEVEAAARAIVAEWPEAWDRVTWQPNGQGHKPRDSFAPHADVHALRDEIRREFPDGLALWSVAPFTPGTAPRRPADECDISGFKVLNPDLSHSSVPVEAPPMPIDGSVEARAPPD
jgi:putative DNA primase/helicase